MALNGLIAHCNTKKIPFETLALLPVPAGTDTHRPIPHHEVVLQVKRSLAQRHVEVLREEFATDAKGLKMFGVLDLSLDLPEAGGRFSIGLRNSHDKSMTLGLCAGARVVVCDNMMFSGDFSMIKKHSKYMNLLDVMAIGIERAWREMTFLRQSVEAWQANQIDDSRAKCLLYDAFIAGEIEETTDYVGGNTTWREIAGSVHDNYFDPQFDEFKPRTLWSLHNAFTSAFGALGDPMRQFQATNGLARYWPKVEAKTGLLIER